MALLQTCNHRRETGYPDHGRLPVDRQGLATYIGSNLLETIEGNGLSASQKNCKLFFCPSLGLLESTLSKVVVDVDGRVDQGSGARSGKQKRLGGTSNGGYQA